MDRPATAVSASSAPRGEGDETKSLVERYSEMSHAYERRRGDGVLRGFDLLIAGSVLLVCLPLLLALAVTIALVSGRPILYRGARVGRHGQIFTMFKFRTLSADAEVRLGPYYGDELTARSREEMIPLGAALRALHLDEIPQLFNVISGQMSIVGPRPIRPSFFEELCERVPQYWQRLVVRPGVTGFAQTRITREEAWDFKLAHDLEYIADRSVGLYLRVLVATAVRVLRRAARGVAERLRPAREQR